MVDVDAFNFVVGSSDPQTRGRRLRRDRRHCPQVDQFDGTALDPKWEIANPTPANLAVGGGNLTLTSAVGRCLGRELHRPQHPPAGGPRRARGR